MGGRPLFIAGLVALAALLAAGGCAAPLSGNGVAGEPDIRALDTGGYPTQPPALSALLNEVERLRLEAARMAGAVLSPHEVDPKYAFGGDALAHTDPQSVARYLAEPVVSVLPKYGFVVGFSTASADTARPLLPGGQGARTGEGLTVTVLRFPDPAAARAAAGELDAIDLGLSPQNVAVPLPGSPGTLAHWRPSVPTLGSTTAHGVYVISVLADARRADLAYLVGMTQRYLVAERGELDRFTPTPVGKFDTLRQDPDSVLVRALHIRGTVPGPDGSREVVYTERGYLNFIQDQAGRFPVLRHTGVDRVAVTPDVLVFRARDAASARQFVDDSAVLGDPVDRRAVDPPQDVPDSRCVQDYLASVDGRFRCYVAYRRYAALVFGSRLWDAQARAAAQYALFANSG